MRALEDRGEQRAFDVADHHFVEPVRRLSVQPAEILVQRVLDAAADLIRAVEACIFFHAARASPPQVAWRASTDGTGARRASTACSVTAVAPTSTSRALRLASLSKKRSTAASCSLTVS